MFTSLMLHLVYKDCLQQMGHRLVLLPRPRCAEAQREQLEQMGARWMRGGWDRTVGLIFNHCNCMQLHPERRKIKSSHQNKDAQEENIVLTVSKSAVNTSIMQFPFSIHPPPVSGQEPSKHLPYYQKFKVTHGYKSSRLEDDVIRELFSSAGNFIKKWWWTGTPEVKMMSETWKTKKTFPQNCSQRSCSGNLKHPSSRKVWRVLKQQCTSYSDICTEIIYKEEWLHEMSSPQNPAFRCKLLKWLSCLWETCFLVTTSEEVYHWCGDDSSHRRMKGYNYTSVNSVNIYASHSSYV